MAVTLGNVTAQEIRNVTSTPVSGTFTHDNNGDGLVIFMLALDASTPSTDADYTATYNGVDVPSQVETETGLTDDLPRGEILYLESAASGENTVAWEFDHPNGGEIDSYLIVAVSVSGNGGIGAVAFLASAGSSLSVDIDVEAIGSLILGAGAVQGFDAVPFAAGSAYSLLSGATDLQSDTASTNSDIAGSVQSKITTATGNQAFDMSWNTSDGACLIAIEILEAGGALESTAAVETDSAITATTETIQESTAPVATNSDIAAVTETIQESTAAIAATSEIAAVAPAEITTNAEIDTASDITASSLLIAASTSEISVSSEITALTETIQESTALIQTVSDITALTEGGGEAAAEVRDVDGPPVSKTGRRKPKRLSKNQIRARERERQRREAALLVQMAADEQDARDAMQAIQVLINQGVI